jgi:hypothetical protein
MILYYWRLTRLNDDLQLDFQAATNQGTLLLLACRWRGKQLGDLIKRIFLKKCP